jgi:hypothetical protein
MSDQPHFSSKELTMFACGPSTATCKCTCGTKADPRVCEHKWDGAEEFREYPEGGCSSSVTCSRCGMSAMSHDMWCF